MTGTAARIRWNDNVHPEVWGGTVGSLKAQLFTIAGPLQSERSYLLMTRLPGMENRSCYRSKREDAQAEAERWLEEFVTSLGAAFPEPAFELEDDDDDNEPLEVRYAAGRRVRYAHPGAGYPGEAEHAAAALTPGEVYTIGWADIGQSRTDLNLYRDGKSAGRFNSVFFEIADDPVTPETSAPRAGEE